MLDHKLYTFLALYEEMNYRRTAKRLNMTQPGVSQHIKHLEGEFGVKLFEYNGKTLSRTRHAESLRKHLSGIQAEIYAAREDFICKEELRLRVGATKTVGEYVILPTVEAYLSRGGSLELTVDNTDSLLELIDRAELDFAIVEGVFDKSRYPHRLYKSERFVGICSREHHFAGRSVSLSETFSEQLILRERGSGTRRLLEGALADRGYSVDSFGRHSSISSFSLICELVARGDAISFAYEPIALSHPGLAAFELSDIEIKGEFNFVYASERLAEERIARFLS